MALRAVPEHPKFAALKAELKLSKFQALGLLEALWHFTGRFAPRGNIGRFTDQQIEAWLEWNGDTGEAIEGLVNSGWLDRSEEHRLMVHDWSQAADELVHADLARKCVLFADGTIPSTRRLNKHERERFHAANLQTVCKESAPKPSKGGSPAASATKPEPAPAPAPAPEPAPALDAPTVEEIVCAHPLAVTRKLTELQVTPSMSSAVVDALAAGETRTALLAKTQAIAQVVLSEWPPGQMRFLKSIDRFFRECEFNKPLEEWRNGSVSDDRQTARVSPAVQRGVESRNSIDAAVARAIHRASGAVDERSASRQAQPTTPARHVGHVPGEVAGDGSDDGHGRVPPRTIEGTR